MRKSISRRSVLVLILLFVAVSATAQNLRVDYVVNVADTDKNLFHVTATVQNVNSPTIDLSLPTWTPGWYVIENYARNILRFVVTDENGRPLAHTMPKKQTWRVETQGHHTVKAEFDYHASVLALNQAKITKDFAFFTGTELFLQASGARNNPSTVKFVVPPGWKILSALKETSDPSTFTADNYDALVDAPTALGSFDVTKFEVEGKPHYFMTYPAGDLPADVAQKVTSIMSRIATAEGAIYGGLPYDKYIYFYLLRPPESNAGGALEHLNAFVSFYGRGADVAKAPIENWGNTAAHEYFHLWNVKRIRPAEMWPYDYSRENETPSLWVSEGVTSYYAPLSLYRAGIRDRKWFLNTVGGSIGGVENDEARKYISPAESSASTWLGYDTPVAFGISYYTQGENLGALLDLSILHDTNGAARLDDVMRSLYNDFYKKGKGFTNEDLIGVINRVSRHDYHDFFRKYVTGTEVPDYDAILGYAGYLADKKPVQRPKFDWSVRRGPNDSINVTDVDAGGASANSGLQKGDLIISAEGKPALQYRWFDEGNVGKPIAIVVRRGNEEKQLTLTPGALQDIEYTVVELPNASPEQVRIREAWLTVPAGRAAAAGN